MPVPSTITDLSDSAASNFPQDSDSTGSTVASLPRNLSAIIKKQFIRGSDVAVVSSGSVTLNAEYSYFVVTGSGYNITGFSDAYNGRKVTLKFSGALTLVNSASLILPNAANITTAAGDVAAFVNESSGVWRCLYFNRTTGIQIDASGNLGLGVTPSAWTGGRAVDLGLSGAVFGDGYVYNWTSGISQNAYRLSDGSYKYKAAQPAAVLELTNNGFNFKIAPSGTAGNAITFTQAATIDAASGNLLVTSPAGLGYGTGSGGTVTQATSKTASVALNKPTGQITTAADSIGANSMVQFVVYNSLVTSYDIILLSQAGYSIDTARYRFSVNAVTTGGFVISIYNQTASSWSDAIPINFVIIKGATS